MNISFIILLLFNMESDEENVDDPASNLSFH
jgi:hypothetical protein